MSRPVIERKKPSNSINIVLSSGQKIVRDTPEPVQPKIETKPESPAETKPEPKNEIQPEPKIETKPEPPAEPKPDPKPGIKPEPKLETKVDVVPKKTQRTRRGRRRRIGRTSH